MTNKKGTPFQKAHMLDFALKIVSTNTHGDVTVWCLFYLYQGGDVVETATAIQKTKDRMKTVKLAGFNDRIISQYTHVLIIVALQQITSILDDESV
ncbi:unnamed protein product [Sphagnum jensenii]|uniref:LAGLIDADG homing endonuclease n=1 Tax=Sphagnum jensenii TaxID=128206 RepID=A0ABP1C0V1_9BRYO